MKDPQAVEQERIATEYQQSTEDRRADHHGVIVTPVEIVDFMNRAVAEVLHREFGVTLANPGVHVLDPFTGTGIFPARLLQTADLTPAEKADLAANRLEAWEIDPAAAEVARRNLRDVIVETTGQAIEPQVRVCDTFAEPPACEERE